MYIIFKSRKFFVTLQTEIYPIRKYRRFYELSRIVKMDQHIGTEGVYTLVNFIKKKIDMKILFERERGPFQKKKNQLWREHSLPYFF